MIFRFTFFCISLFVASHSSAQDRCADVLAGGAFRSLTSSSKQLLTSLAYQKIADSTTANKSDTLVLGIDVPIEGVPVGIDLKRKKSEAINSSMNRLNLHYLTRFSSLDYAILDGDPVIVRAWTECMSRRRGGVLARFSVVEPNIVQFLISHLPEPGIDNQPRSTVLVSDVEFWPRLKFSAVSRSGSRLACVRSGYRLTARECGPTISVDPKMPMRATFSTNNYSDITITLPPRIIYQEEGKDLNDVDLNENFWVKRDLIPGTASRGREKKYFSWQLPENLVNQGWVFDPVSVSVEVSGTTGKTTCRHDVAVITPLKITIATTSDNNDHDVAVCVFYLRRDVRIFRIKAVPFIGSR